MSINANLPVAEIAQLAATLTAERAKLDGELNRLLGAVQRDPKFVGSAADKYDAYIQQWHSGQVQMLEGLGGAATLLHGFAERLTELNLQVAQGFNI